MWQNLSSAAVLIGALRVKLIYHTWHGIYFISFFQLMGCGVAGPTGQYAVQHVGLVHSSERGSVSFPSELHMDKTVLVLRMNKETAVIVLAQVR